ncbi:substrate-binding periplasmic protein [Agarivorans gilvus]|uniref:Solute-binding protein family 3/N-terminal domain-containing protein n=1 Tax=Agarivorans gilvus TaxID=680279 RepID=A0ABQ1I6A9_9ALTE|nr:transporter substrate-binding domain-containing protein [Agarivorans gilvus]GGB20930.1 hypothetical protein GCM10007414_37920 [Agarivorans gilvus]
MYKKYLFMFLVVGLSMLSAVAKPVSISTPYYTDLTNEQLTGPYQIILREAARRSGLRYAESFYPEKRALRLFMIGMYDCTYGYSDEMKRRFGEDNILLSFPFGLIKEYMFTKKGTQALTSIEQLRGKSVGATLGTERWHKHLTDLGIQVRYVVKDINSIRMLEDGRIDVFLGFLPDLTKYIDRLSYSPQHPIVVA